MPTPWAEARRRPSVEAPGGRPRAPMVAKWIAPSQKAWVTVSLCAQLLMAGFLAAFVLRKYADMAQAAGIPIELQSYAYAVLVAA